MPVTESWMHQQVAQIEKHRAKAKEFKEHAAMESARAEALVGELRAELVKGSTTGDTLCDLVIRAHGFNPELEAHYRVLQEELRGKKSEFVLLSFVADIQTKYTMRGRESERRNWYRLGVLQEERLRWDTSEKFSAGITLPISQYIEGEQEALWDGDSAFKRRIKVEKRNIFAQSYGDADPPSLVALIQGAWRTTICIGDGPVKRWLEERAMLPLYKPAAAALSKLILEATE